MTASWLALIHPANFWWMPLTVMGLGTLLLLWSFRDGTRGVPGHILGVAITLVLIASAIGWLVYIAGAIIWLFVH